MFAKSLNYLKKQKIIKEQQMIGVIKVLQKAQLHKEQAALNFAKQGLEQVNISKNFQKLIL